MGDLKYTEGITWLVTWLAVVYLVVKGLRASKRIRKLEREKLEREKVVEKKTE